jgi:O-antigen ligase
VASPIRASTETVATIMLAILAAALGLVAGKDAAVAVGVAAALSFIALLVADYRLAVGVFIVSTFLQLPGGASKGIGAVLVLAWIAMLTTRGRGEFQDFASEHKGMTLLLLAFIAWTLLGVLWASSPSAVLTSLGRYIPNFAAFFVIYAAANKRINAITLIAFFVLGGAMAAVYGVIHPPAATTGSDLSRAGGTLGDPNGLASALVVTLAFGAALAAMRSLAPLVRVAAVMACAFSVAGILLSLSRGGLVALAVALLTGVFVAGKWRVPMATIALLLAVVSVGYFGAVASPAAVQRITTNNDGSGRTDIWAIGWRMFEAHPLNGVGAGNFPLVSKDYLLRPGLTTHADYVLTTPKLTHNTYLGILAEGGIPAVILFLAIVAASMRCIQRAWREFRRRGDQELELLCYAVFAGAAGFLAASFFLSSEFSKQLWIVLAFGPLLQRVSTLTSVADRARGVARAR